MLPQSARKRKIRAHKLAEAVQDEGAEEGSAPSSDESSAGNESSDESTVGGQHQPKRARTVEFADEAFVAVFVKGWIGGFRDEVCLSTIHDTITCKVLYCNLPRTYKYFKAGGGAERGPRSRG
ncbi:hypothetical protein GQ600_18828 [Phytophthora cactorum]|nr:hypothetical protein GQ600_18828 [Phytophthora cactorum]